ncbi:amino acid ABC transporter ATP-binding/permease protein [Gracilibacillus sp. Marseille-QA3620]
MEKLTFKELRQLVSLLKPLLPLMLLTIALGTLGYLAITAISFAGGMGVLQIAGIREYGSLKLLIYAILLAGVLRAVFRLSEQYCTHYIAFRLLAIIREKVFKQLRLLTENQLKEIRKGELMNIVTKDVELLEVFYAHTIAPVFIWIATMIVYGAMLYSLHPLYALIGVISYWVIGYLIPVAVYRFGQRSAEVYRTKQGMLSSFLMDSLKGIKEIIIFGKKNHTLHSIDTYSHELNGTTKNLKRHEGLLKALTDTMIYLTVFVQLFTSVYFITERESHMGAVLLAMLVLFSSFGPSLALSQLSASLVHTSASAKRVLRLLNLKPDILYSGRKKLDQVETIRFEDVKFGYENGRELYRHVNLTFHKGEITAIRGANGTGKSTLISLLLQNLRPLEGNVYINDELAMCYSHESLRQNIGLVTASTTVFTDTLRNNLTLYQKGYTDEQIKQACFKAGLSEYVESLPKGLDTFMEEYAANMSSGQVQRIALARMFLKDSPIFILDEPTSNLDALNEKAVLATIKRHAADKVVLLISHNEDVWELADQVYKIENKMIQTA